MIVHPQLHCLVVSSSAEEKIDALAAYLATMDHVQVTRRQELPHDLSEYHVALTATPDFDPDQLQQLNGFVRAGRGWLWVVQKEQVHLPEIFGTRLAPGGPDTELRVLFAQHQHPLATRLPEAIYVHGNYRALEPSDDHTEILLYADWHYTHQAVLTLRSVGDGQAAATTLQALDHEAVQRILYRLVRQMAGQNPAPRSELGVGILGYAPSVGELHGLGVTATDGLALKAACDMDPQRRDQAEKDFPGLRTYASADQMVDNPDVQAVIIATPPNSHAPLSIRFLEAGRHVVCEKPLALNPHETEQMAASAQAHGVLLCCHQNRRFDVDYLAIRSALTKGLMGELFYLETFVGGFHHPCGFWHSHAPVCGGTTFDWGAHYLDWIVGLVREPVASVQCTRHKLVWHDVTNADQERILLRFSGGQEAEFMHSDIAAVSKPKWYLLGTKGAVVGHWHDVTTYMPDQVHYYEPYAIPATEMPPKLNLRRRDRDGSVYTQQLALPARQPYAFHRNLADHLLLGEPLAAPLEDSIKVVAILEAAVRSASQGGSRETLHG